MPIILWFCVSIAIGAYITGPIMDPDLWWHITVGRWIWAQKAVPVVDHWNLFGAGKPWVAYSWSNEVVYALVESHFGILGLLSLKLGLAALIGLSFFWVLYRLSKDLFIGGAFGALTTLSVFNHFTLRPQSLIWVVFVWLIYFCEEIRSKGLTAKSLFGIFLCMFIWANTHISGALGLFLIFCWLIEVDVFLTVKVLALGFIATLLTPYLGAEWLVFLGTSSHPFSHKTIVEFHPANITQHSTGFVIFFGAILLYFAHYMPRALGTMRLLGAIVFLLAGVTVVKFLPFASIIICALIALYFREGAFEVQGLGEGVRRLKHQFERIPEQGLAFLFLCLLAVSISRVWARPLSQEIVPQAAVDFMFSQNLPKPWLNDFEHGGYMIYRLSDRKGAVSDLVPIDGRTNVTPQEVFDKADAALRGKANWQEYLDMVKPNTILWPSESPLCSILEVSGMWCRVFHSGDNKRGHSVFVRRGAGKVCL